MKRCPNSLSLRRFSGLLASSLTSSVSFFPWGLWAKSLARLNSDAIGRSLREGRGPRPQEGRRSSPPALGIAHIWDPADTPNKASDFTDNAVGLIHIAGPTLEKLASNYAVPGRVARHAELHTLIP